MPGHTGHVFSTWKDNPHASHTFLMPTAIPLQQGQGYYQNSYVIMHSAWFAPLENVSVGGGFQMMSVLASLRPGQDKLPGYYLAVRGGARIQPGIHVGLLAIGTQLSSPPKFADTVSVGSRVGALIGQATFGTMEANVTLDLGWCYTRIGFLDKPLFGLAAQWRFTEPLAVVTENWIINLGPEPLPVYTVGMRYIHRKLGADVGLAYNKDLAEGLGPVVPYIGFALRF